MVDREPCPRCGHRIEWRTVEYNPYMNRWEPYCPTCGFNDPVPADGGDDGP